MRPKLDSSSNVLSPNILSIFTVIPTSTDSATGLPLSVIVAVKLCTWLVSKSKGKIPFTEISPVDELI